MPSDEPGSISGDKKFTAKPANSPLPCSGSLAPNVQRVSRTTPVNVQLAQVNPQQMLSASDPCAARTPDRRSPAPRSREPADRRYADCSRTHRPTAPAAAPRSSTARAARAPPDRRAPTPAPASSRAGSSVDGTSSNTASTSSSGSVAMSSPNSRLDAALGARHVIRAVHERRHLAREHALRFALLRRRGVRVRRARRSPSRSRNVKNFRYGIDVAIVGVQPELIEGERRRPLRHRARPRRLRSCRTSRPIAVVMSGQTRPCAFCAAQLANQIDAGGDVAPLIAAAHLQRAAEADRTAAESRTPAAADS